MRFNRHTWISRVIESTFAELGLEVHEKLPDDTERCHSSKAGLGCHWEFDTHKMVMVLPEATWRRFSAMLTAWHDEKQIHCL